MTIFDPYNDPNRPPTSVDTARQKRSQRRSGRAAARQAPAGSGSTISATGGSTISPSSATTGASTVGGGSSTVQSGGQHNAGSQHTAGSQHSAGGEHGAHPYQVGGQIQNRSSSSRSGAAPGYGPSRPSRSPILTALVSFISLSIVPVTVILSMLIWVNQELCADGVSTVDCQNVDATVSGLMATGITGLSALVVSMIGGGRIKRGHNTAGLILAVVAVAAMAILVSWLRANLGVPFPT